MPAATKARKLSASHKRALAEGRTMSATVDRYLQAVNTPKRRGRKVSRTTLESRIAVARVALRTGTGVEKVIAAQTIRDCQDRLVALTAQTNGGGLRKLEADFVKIAKTFGENRGIGYGAWRDAGVPAAVLRKAKIPRTRTNHQAVA